MPEKWFYVNTSGDVVGPVAVSALKKLVEQKLVIPSTILISEDGTKEFEAGKVSALFKSSDSSSVGERQSDTQAGAKTVGPAGTPESPVTRSLTPLPSAQTLPLAPKQPTAKASLPAPPAPEMPLAAINPFDSGVPTPIVLRSDGEKIVRVNHSNWKDSVLIWIIAGICIFFLLGSLLVNFTWKMAVRHATDMGQHLPKYEGKIEQKTIREDGSESTSFAEPHPPTPETIMARSEKSIAQINGPVSCGTGFVVAPGIVVTNSHVIASEKVEQLEIVFPALEGTQRGPFKPRLLYEDTVRDLALLGIDNETIPVLPLLNDYSFRRAQRIMTIGNPGRGDGVVLENAVSAGILSTQIHVDGLPFYQLSIAVNKGNSGGPVLDDEGRVIGMITLKSVKSPSMAFCIPVDDVEQAIQLEKNLTEKDRKDMNEAHLVVVGLRRGQDRPFYESPFGEVDADSQHRSGNEFALTESSQRWYTDKQPGTGATQGSPGETGWSVNHGGIAGAESSLSQLSEEERENLMSSNREERYRQILAKEKWTFNGTPLYGNIVGFRDGIVQIRLKGAADDEVPLERYARRFSASDINDILFYARYHRIPTGNLGRR